MRPLDQGLTIPAGEEVALKPGGGHVMISGLTSPLHVGGALKLTLRFEHSGEKIVDFKVAPAMGGMAH